jgi:hypothetical protein
LLMANMMREISTSLTNEKRKVLPRWFNCYASTYQVPGEIEWSKECEHLLILHLTTPNMKMKIERWTAYKEVSHLLASIYPYVDVLGGNDLITIAGTLGLLPLWVTSEIEIHKGRPLNWLLTKTCDNKMERLI